LRARSHAKNARRALPRFRGLRAGAPNADAPVPLAVRLPAPRAR
jgi:hypothetical protein